MSYTPIADLSIELNGVLADLDARLTKLETLTVTDTSTADVSATPADTSATPAA